MTQFVRNHQNIPASEYSDPNGKVQIPGPEELPNIDLEVLNYHRPMLGTFHAKFMVVDRKVACLNSNNIQDRPNVEMMVHLEGPIVEGFYDMALLSWNNALNPPLPLLNHPPNYSDMQEYKFEKDNEHLSCEYSMFIAIPRSKEQPSLCD